MLNVTMKPHRAFLAAGNADAQKVFAMLKVIPDAETAKGRSPLAMAVVVDTSGSMREFADQEAAEREINRRGLHGKHESSDDRDYQSFDLKQKTKLDQAIDAVHRLIDDPRLRADDKLTIVQFDTEATALLPLTSLVNQQLAHNAADSLRDHSGETFMGKGMSCAQSQLVDLTEATAKRLLLLTDGATRAEGQCRKIAGELAESNTPIIALGLGDEYKEELLRELADLSRGRPYHLRSSAQLQEIFNDEIGSSVREVVTDLHAAVSTVKGVSLDSVARVYPSLAEVAVDSGPVRLGNVAAGDFTVFILEFTVSGFARPPSRARLAQVSLTASLPAADKRETVLPQDIFISFTNDESAVAGVDAEVLGYVQQKNVDRLVHQAVGQATINASQARQTLQVALGMTQRVGNAGMTRVLQGALDELNKTGTISAGTRKTVVLGGRTKTVKAGGTMGLEGGPSDDDIRKLSGV